MSPTTDDGLRKENGTSQNESYGIRVILSQTLAVFNKEVTSEFRTRHAANAVLLFAATTILAIGFSMGGSVTPQVQSALLWIIIYFSAMLGLSRVFVREEETGTSAVLRLTSTPESVFLGKLLFNVLLLAAIEAVTLPLFVGVLGLQVAHWPLFLVSLISGSAGLAVATTIVAAMVSRAQAKGALFAAIAFPIVLPALIIGIKGTLRALLSDSCSAAFPEVRLLISYAGVLFVVSLMLFRFVWED